jgi:hypothetical protein
MLHPFTRLTWVNDAVGYGVVATRDIPKGTILWALDSLDQVFTAHEVRKLGASLLPVLETYSYVNGNGKRILCWDHGRYMNHSCDPVSLSPGVDFELAVRDIAAGEEVTCDYASLNLEQDLECLCGAPGCRKRITSEAFAELAPIWDARLRAAVRFADTVEQPLLHWLKRPEMVAKWANDPESLPTAKLHQYPRRPHPVTVRAHR